MLEFDSDIFLDLLLFFTFLINFFDFQGRFINLDDTDEPEKLYNSDGSNGCSGSFGLSGYFTESVAVGRTGGVNDISEHGNIKK